MIPAFSDIIAITGADKIWSRSLASANLTDSLMMVERLGPRERAKRELYLRLSFPLNIGLAALHYGHLALA